MGIWEFIAGFVLGLVIGGVAGWFYGVATAGWGYAKVGAKAVKKEVERRLAEEQAGPSDDETKLKSEILLHCQELNSLGEKITMEEIHHKWGDEGVVVAHELARKWHQGN